MLYLDFCINLGGWPVAPRERSLAPLALQGIVALIAAAKKKHTETKKNVISVMHQFNS